jgi:hypothetical protein
VLLCCSAANSSLAHCRSLWLLPIGTIKPAPAPIKPHVSPHMRRDESARDLHSSLSLSPSHSPSSSPALSPHPPSLAPAQAPAAVLRRGACLITVHHNHDPRRVAVASPCRSAELPRRRPATGYPSAQPCPGRLPCMAVAKLGWGCLADELGTAWDTTPSACRYRLPLILSTLKEGLHPAPKAQCASRGT